MNESGNWIIFFFKEKIILKNFKLLGHPSRESAFSSEIAFFDANADEQINMLTESTVNIRSNFISRENKVCADIDPPWKNYNIKNKQALVKKQNRYLLSK